MELMSVTGMQMGVLATLLMVVAMGGFIAGVKVTNAEHRRSEPARPWTPPVPQYAATRIPEPQPPAGAVVHVHLPAMPMAWSQPPVLTGHVVPALAERSDR
jgi:hypothetical protein